MHAKTRVQFNSVAIQSAVWFNKTFNEIRDSFFRKGMIFENKSNIVVTYVILTVCDEMSSQILFAFLKY